VIREGQTEIYVANGVFYNPRMELSRDISVACIAAFSHRATSYIDALAATGVMGIRIANELDGMHVTINDWSKRAYELILKNVKSNDVECVVHHENANAILSTNGYDVVDIDPFGSPVPFLDSSCSSAHKLLVVTATDTAPLCGAHENAGIRKYAAVPLNTEYHKEMGIRVLLGKIFRDLARHDKSAQPLLSYTTAHFIKSYIYVEKGARKADECLKGLGFILHCFECGYRSSIHGLVVFLNDRCPNCGSRLSMAGPLYLGPIHDKGFCREAIRELERNEFFMRKRAINLLERCSEEMDLPFYYDHHNICRRLKVTALAMEDLICKLRGNGFSATRTHFSGTSFKTNAPYQTILGLLK
jgi:tRNA (guanine26-N2/guanine27-N2)-dimethyltransferase